jgi:hypothetical protein
MNIDIKQFSGLQKASKTSFFQQKNIVKKLMAGQIVTCSKCNKPLQLFTPEAASATGIRCAKGCTDIQLDFA